MDKGCICQTKCPLAKQVGLTYKDFCLKGSESAQRYVQ
ncbi:MAG: hypothetical protein LUO82_06055 [Methanomicrobiales archaeon]|nr:hypothetical protein [Methanomicrobiales archaeon]